VGRTRLFIKILILAGCFALFVWRELGAMRADGVTLDEPVHLAYGERALRQGTFERGADLYNSKMPVSVLNALPAWLAERRDPGATLDPARRLWLARLPVVALGAILGGLVFCWAATLFGFRGGALALFLYTFCPTVLAHSHLVTTDVATALGMFGATYAFWLYRRQPTAWRLAVAAAAFGAAQLTKVTAIFLLPIFALIALLEALRARRLARDLPAGPAPPEGRQPILVPALALGAGLLLAVNLGFAGERTLTPLSRYAPVSGPFRLLAALPVVRDLPLPLPLPYVQGLDMVARDTGADAAVYLHGQISRHGFWQYFLVALAVKTPAGTLGLLALALWLWASGRVRAPGADAYLLVPAAFLLAYLSFALGLQLGLRYLLPALPFLFVFTARVAVWRPVASFFGAPAAVSTLVALVALLAGWTAVSSLGAHPRYIPYFNELIGGARNGYHWLADSNLDWGQDGAYMHGAWARSSPVPVWFDPSGPIAGRVAVGLSSLVENPQNAWLRDHFQPTAIVRRSWAVFDLDPAAVERCCAGQPWAWPLPDAAGNLAAEGQAIGGAGAAASGGAGTVEVRLLARLNDGMLGANSDHDAARSAPSPVPLAAWFGIAWAQPRAVGRVVAYPAFYSRGPSWRRFLAADYVWQWWDGRRWLDLPGTRVTGNDTLRVEHRFPPVRAAAVRLWIGRERNALGTDEVPGVFRAACLEVAVFPR
jgi:hypothetical protein